MTWLKIDNPEIDTDKLQSDIETEVVRIKTDPEFSSLNGDMNHTAALKTPEDSPALIEIAEAYAAGWDGATLARRRPILKPFLPLLEKLLRKLLKPQYIFNSLTLEIIRKQEERIQALEELISKKNIE
ncbi:MAG TPA: hypothetical protein ENH12_05040 [Proteobacteria bacterium]|nr:hypothetical protein [Pseudomonadota bacterium]